MKAIKSIIFITVMLLCSSLNAQVTIGSDQKPAEGALLDLIQHSDRTSSKGLGLPRVALVDPGKLAPMFKYDGINEPSSVDKESHTGLMVYNVSECDNKFNKGIYIWDGSLWVQLLDKPVPPGAPSVIAKVNGVARDSLIVPSGLDLRGTTMPTFSLEVSLGALEGATMKPSSKYTNAATMFNPTPSTWIAGTTQNLSTLIDAYTLVPNAMSNTDFPNINNSDESLRTPWYSRQWELKYDIPTNSCGSGVSKTIYINQTNYALKVNSKFSNSSFEAKSNVNTASFPVQGNAKWKATMVNNTVFGSTMSLQTTSGGAELINGTTNTANVSFSSSTRHDEGVITISDTELPKRFNDIKVSVTMHNCSAKAPTIEEWAKRIGYTDAEISAVVDAEAKSSTIKNGYQLHRDQDGNLFISQDFGQGGRWMLSNLAATTYASKVTHPHRTLQGPIANLEDIYNTAYWAYPSSTVATSDANYKADKRLGLLYTWDAATAEKGGLSGNEKPTEDEKNLPEGTGTGFQKRVQGICPNGWHLPSSYEIGQLAIELQKNTSQYSSLDDGLPPYISGTESSWPSDLVEKMIGATTDRCITTLTYPSLANLISPTKKSGFGSLATGFVEKGENKRFNELSVYTSSSSSHIKINNNGYYASGMYLHIGSAERDIMNPVRCKKDQ